MSYTGSHTYATLSGRTLEFLLSGPKTDREVLCHLLSSGRTTDARLSSITTALRSDGLIHYYHDSVTNRNTSALTTNGTVLAILIKLERLAILHADAFLIKQIAKARKETAALLRKP